MASVGEHQTPVQIVPYRPISGQRPVDSLILAAADTHQHGDGPEPIRWLVSHPDAPEEFLLDLCARGEFLDDLGHRSGPRRLLEELATRHNYPEAILTLGKDYFTNPNESVDSFRNFLTSHREMPWLLESLARQRPNLQEKEAVLLELAADLANIQKVQGLIEERNLRERAMTETEVGELEALYCLNQPMVWRELAANPNTPIGLVRALREVKGIKYSREIRDRAQRNLESRS